MGPELLLVALCSVVGVILGSWSLAQSVPARLRARINSLESIAVEAQAKAEALGGAHRQFIEQVEAYLEAIGEKAATIERKRRSTATAAARVDQAQAEQQPASRSEQMQLLRRRAGMV